MRLERPDDAYFAATGLPAAGPERHAHAGNRASAPPDEAALVAAFGEPARWAFRITMASREFRMLDVTGQDGRWQDATVLIRDPDAPDVVDRFVVIAKHWYPDGVYRLPSGTVKPGERIVDTAVREAREETGLDVELSAYLLATDGSFVSADGLRSHPWRSHVFLATPLGATIEPEDTREIASARVLPVAHLTATIHPHMLELAVGGFRYRVGLQERAFTALGLMDGPKLVTE